MAFQRMNMRHATKAVVDAIFDTFFIATPAEWPATTALDRVRSLDATNVNSITQVEIALINGVSMSQLASGNCDAFDTQSATFWTRILFRTEKYWSNPSLYPVINGLNIDGTVNPNGIKQTFDQTKFPMQEMKCDVAGGDKDSNCRDLIFDLTGKWKAAQ